MTGCGDEALGWRLDRRLNLGTFMSVVTALVVVVAMVAGLKTRLEVVEDKLCAVERRVEEARSTAIKVERIEERVKHVQSILLEIKGDLRRNG